MSTSTLASHSVSYMDLDKKRARPFRDRMHDDIQRAQEAIVHLLNDDPNEAETRLKAVDSLPFRLGLGLVGFLKGILGEEREVLKDAMQRLDRVESAGHEGLERLRHDADAYSTDFYPPGMEFSFCMAEAQIMWSILAFKSVSIPNILKAIPKLRKALSTLSGAEAIKDGRTDLHTAITANIMDRYIYTGTCLLRGAILVLLSAVPPSYGKYLAMVGIKGDRTRGLALLWEAAETEPTSDGPDQVASNSPAIHSLAAGLSLADFYCGLIAPSDTALPSEFPQEMISKLINSLEVQFPKSTLVTLARAGFLAATRNSAAAAATIEAIASPSPLKQLEYARHYDLGQYLMCMGDYRGAASSFQRAVDLIESNKSIYHYLAGASYVELYRQSRFNHALGSQEDGGWESLASTAEDFFCAAEAELPKRGLFGGRLGQFDAFVEAKLAKWRHRAAARGGEVRLVDAVGVSPTEEMGYIWGLTSRKTTQELRASLEKLWFSDAGSTDAAADDIPEVFAGAGPSAWTTNGVVPTGVGAEHEFDELAALAVLRAAIYRQTGETATARTLSRGVIQDPQHPWRDFKAAHRDAWPAPMARHEAAACAWLDAGLHREHPQREEPLKPSHSQRIEMIREAQSRLAEVAAWDRFGLERALSVKVSSAARDADPAALLAAAGGDTAPHDEK